MLDDGQHREQGNVKTGNSMTEDRADNPWRRAASAGHVVRPALVAQDHDPSHLILVVLSNQTPFRPRNHHVFRYYTRF